jgi:hypothetical protein
VTTGTSSLSVGHQLARAITPNLVGRLESVAMLVQAGGIVTTAAVDKLLPSGQALLLAIAGFHVVFAALVLRFNGPFRWGRCGRPCGSALFS